MKPHHKNRSRAYYRHQRKRVIQRKAKIAKQIGWYSRFAGSLAKGKIHCSCSICAQKTNKDGFPHSQKTQLERLDSQLCEYFSEREY